MNFADLYGIPSSAVGTPTIDQPVGPNPSSVTGGGQRAVSSAGAASMSAGPGAAFSWLGFALALVILRLLIEFGPRG